VAKKPAPLLVWVPPGSPMVVSQGVEVRTIGEREGLAGNDTGRAPVGDRPVRDRRSTHVWKGGAGWARGQLGARSGDGKVESGGEPDETLSVPPEIEAMAAKVVARYDMKVSGKQLITTKPDKGGAIWRIETNRGPRSLKLLHRPPARNLFSIGAQEYLREQGARVPALIKSKDRVPYVVIDGHTWIVTEWVEPLYPAPKVGLEGAASLCFGLGEFHKKSRGYVPPQGAQKASRLYRWPKTYEKTLTKIGWFRILGEAYSEMPAARTLLSVVGRFEQQAKRAVEMLQRSPYGKLIARGEPDWGIAHQDYGWSNGQIGPGGIWIIDLDGVAYDLAIRDLRKLITSTMDDLGAWDPAFMKGMIDAYNKGCRIESDLYQVLLIDMALPNEFYKHLKEMVFDPTFLDAQTDALLHRLVETDATKWTALKELGLKWEGSAR